MSCLWEKQEVLVGLKLSRLGTIFTSSSNSIQYLTLPKTLPNIAHVETVRRREPVCRCVVYVIYTVIKKSFTAGCDFLNLYVSSGFWEISSVCCNTWWKHSWNTKWVEKWIIIWDEMNVISVTVDEVFMMLNQQASKQQNDEDSEQSSNKSDPFFIPSLDLFSSLHQKQNVQQ